MFDSDKASPAINRMWLRLARILDKRSEERAKAGYADVAIQAARYAEACYWQATGEADCVDLKDVIKTPANLTL